MDGTAIHSHNEGCCVLLLCKKIKISLFQKNLPYMQVPKYFSINESSSLIILFKYSRDSFLVRYEKLNRAVPVVLVFAGPETPYTTTTLLTY